MSTRLSVLLFRQVVPLYSWMTLIAFLQVLELGAFDDGPSFFRLLVALPSLKVSCSLASWYVTVIAMSSLLMISKMC